MRIRNLLLTAALLGAAGATAQGIRDVRINEVLVVNENNYQDDYGVRSGWVELFNTGYSNVNVGGCHLTVARGDKARTYRIPKNDKRTVIPPRGYLVFFAEGTSSKGTFHTNFTLDQTGYIALLDQSGRGRAVDSLVYDVAAMKPDISVGRYTGPDGEVRIGELPATTPLADNEFMEQEPRSEHFRRLDPYGVGMAAIAMIVVFTALVVLYQIFKQVGKVLTHIDNRKAAKKASTAGAAAPAPVAGTLDSETLAAIATALHLYREDLHDRESAVITINRVARMYSPWNSKIHGLTPEPERKK